MTKPSPTKIAGTATRDFKDAGTERRFAKGQSVELDAGQFLNYEAAGLVVKKADKPA